MHPFYKGNGSTLEKGCMSCHFKAKCRGFFRTSQFPRFLVSLIEFRILICRCAEPSVVGVQKLGGSTMPHQGVYFNRMGEGVREGEPTQYGSGGGRRVR